jgi:hypothetical protein
MRKGFIGPVGDDLPSIVAVILALGLFFSGVIYSLNAYNDKMLNLSTLKGALEISRSINSQSPLTDGYMQSTARKNANYIAQSYGLKFRDNYTDGLGNYADCLGDHSPPFYFNFLVAKWDDIRQTTELMSLWVCVWR